MYKKLYHLGFIAYAVMLVLALLFYKERTILSDVSYNLFYILKDCSFAIQHFRFGEAFTQSFAVLACKAGISLKGVMLCYSASFVVYYCVGYFICGLLKQYELAVLMLVAQLLLTTETFYYEVSQFTQGITFLLLAMAVLRGNWQMPPTVGRKVLGTSLLIFSVFFHPLILPALFYLLVFYYLDDRKVVTLKRALSVAGLFLGCLVLKSVLLRSPYEGHSLGGLRNFVRLFPDYFTLYSHKRFFAYCLGRYFWVTCVFFSVVVIYVKQREWAKLFLFLLASVGYLFLVNICYPDNVTPSFYIENLYQLLALILAVPFVYNVLQHARVQKYGVLIFGLFLTTGLARVYAARYIFQERLAWERTILDRYAGQKVIASAAKVGATNREMLWGTPYEFWLLSTLETENTASIIIDENPGKRKWAETLTKSLLVNWNTFSYKDLSTRYFHFADTVSGYKVE